MATSPCFDLLGAWTYTNVTAYVTPTPIHVGEDRNVTWIWLLHETWTNAFVEHFAYTYARTCACLMTQKDS